jgi:3-hydroxyacyl-[acyl-carrier-protein] dehydratase
VTGASTGADGISARHPALAGHFPGNPVVPGVVILGRVCEAFRRDHDARVRGVRLVKFHAPLRPAEPFAIHLARTGPGRCAFRVVRGDTLIAAGTLETGDDRQ